MRGQKGLQLSKSQLLREQCPNHIPTKIYKECEFYQIWHFWKSVAIWNYYWFTKTDAKHSVPLQWVLFFSRSQTHIQTKSTKSWECELTGKVSAADNSLCDLSIPWRQREHHILHTAPNSESVRQNSRFTHTVSYCINSCISFHESRINYRLLHPWHS